MYKFLKLFKSDIKVSVKKLSVTLLDPPVKIFHVITTLEIGLNKLSTE